MYDKDPSRATVGPLARYVDISDIPFSSKEPSEEIKTAEAVIDNKSLIKAKANAKLLNKDIPKKNNTSETPETSDMPKPKTPGLADGDSPSGRNEPHTKIAQIKSILSDDSANPVKILKFVTEKWTDDWIDWEPETILQTAVLDGFEISRVNQDKLMALKVLIKTTEFFDSWRIFEKVCLALSGHMVHWGHVQPVRVHEMASSVALVTKYFISADFSDDIKNYVAASAIRDGFILLPAELKFADFEFAKALLENGGDEAAAAQEELINKIKSKSDDVSESDGIQLMRIIRVQHHVSEYMKGAS